MRSNQLQAAKTALADLVKFAEGGAVDLAKLAECGEGYVMPTATQALRRLRGTSRERVRRDLRAFLTAAGSGATNIIVKHMRLHPELVPIMGSVRGLHPDGRRQLFGVDGAPREVLLYQVATFLGAIGEERLQVCPAPECGRLFIKVTKKRFCSQKCQSRIYMRQLRADERAERDALTKGARHGKTTRTR